MAKKYKIVIELECDDKITEEDLNAECDLIREELVEGEKYKLKEICVYWKEVKEPTFFEIGDSLIESKRRKEEVKK